MIDKINRRGAQVWLVVTGLSLAFGIAALYGATTLASGVVRGVLLACGTILNAVALACLFAVVRNADVRPSSIDVPLSLSEIKLHLDFGRTEQARKALAGYLEINPDDTAAHALMQRCAVQMAVRAEIRGFGG